MWMLAHEGAVAFRLDSTLVRSSWSKGNSKMFAPPPVQLSRAEIEARLAARRKNLASTGPLSGTTSSVAGTKTTSLHRHDSRSPTSPRKGDKIQVSAPIVPDQPKKRSGIFKFTAGEVVESVDLPNNFGEQPRKAPTPPKKSTRPPSEWFDPRPKVQSAIHTPSDESDTPPPVPEKSPRRQQQYLQQHLAQHVEQKQFSKEPLLNNALTNLQIRDERVEERPVHPPRSFTAPAASLPVDSILMARSRNGRNGPDRKLEGRPRTNVRRSGVRGSKIDKTSTKRMSNASLVRAALLELNDVKVYADLSIPPRRATEGDIESIRLSSAPDFQLPWKRRRKGETLSMLLESRFFPTESLTRGKNNSNINFQVKIPPPLDLLNKKLLDAPTSIMPTPTELYQGVPPRPTRQVERKFTKGNKKRVPLAQISTTDAKANSSSILEDAEAISPGTLPVIPEYGTMSEKSPVPSGMTTPVATKIHLQGGSVITVSPPELTAWQQRLYTQGPIKLPKPVIVPRKGSVASLEPFQDAIEQVYQEALAIPRRRSDDEVVDDVCEFFDDFGFDGISFEGDVLGVDDKILEEAEENKCSDLDLDQFGIPIVEEIPSPVEKVVAKEIVEKMSNLSARAPPVIPPLDNEETLRAKGIARLVAKAASHGTALPNGRKDSLTLSKPDTHLPLLPVAEETMLEEIAEPSHVGSDAEMEQEPVDQGFDLSDDEIEELDGSSSWLAPGAHRWRTGAHRKATGRRPKNPVRQMRRLVSTASGML